MVADGHSMKSTAVGVVGGEPSEPTDCVGEDEKKNKENSTNTTS